MDDGKNKKKDELLQILSDAKNDAQNLASKGREIVKEGQYAADLASCHEEFIRCIPDDTFFSLSQWNNQIEPWRRWHEIAGEAITSFNFVLPSLSMATNSTSVSSSAAISSVYISALPPNSQIPAQRAFEKYEQLLEKSDLIQELEIELRRLNLTTSKTENESVLSLLHQASQAFRIPSVTGVSPSAVLIPLREAVNRTLANLLVRRPKQEEAKNQPDKVLSICKQCSRTGVATELIDQLANEANDLNRLLSGSKQDVMSRERVRELMNRGFLFLLTFLRTIDENKLRN